MPHRLAVLAALLITAGTCMLMTAPHDARATPMATGGCTTQNGLGTCCWQQDYSCTTGGYAGQQPSNWTNYWRSADGYWTGGSGNSESKHNCTLYAAYREALNGGGSTPPVGYTGRRQINVGSSAWPDDFIHFGEKALPTGPPPGAPAVVHDGYTSVFTVNAAGNTLEETYLAKNGQPWNTQNLSANYGTPPVAAGTTPAAVFHDGYTSVFTINAADNTLQETYLPALGQPWHTQSLSASNGTPPVAAGTSPLALYHTGYTSVFTVNAADNTLQETYLAKNGQPWHTQPMPTPQASAP